MKPSETLKNNYRKFEFVMFACFIMGGLCIFYYVYSVFFISGALTSIANSSLRPRLVNDSFFNNSFYRPLDTLNQPPSNTIMFRLFTAPSDFIILISGIVFLIAGWSLNSLVREKHLSSVKHSVTNALLTPDERLIYELLIKHNGEVTQKELTMLSGLSKVKIFRITKSLESKEVIEKKEYGQTKMIILK